MKELNEMTLKEFNEVPERKWDEVIEGVTSIVFIPNEYTHDSGYRQIDAVCQFNNGELIKIGGCTDSFNFELENKIGIDVLNPTGLVRLFTTYNELMNISPDLSSIYVTPTKQDEQ